jgi:hypothetical protein
MQYSVIAIVANRDGKDFSTSYVVLDIGQDPFMAIVYRTGLIIALEEFFGRVQIFGSELTPAKYCQKEWPGESIDRAVTELVRERGLN